jgi:chromosome segregation ATPase
MSALGPTVAIMAAVTAVGFLVAKLKEHKSASDDDLDSIENMSTAYGKLADNVASAEAKLKSVVTSGAATAEQIVAAEQTLSTERSKSDKEKQEDLDKYNESLKKKQDLEAIIAIREAQIATGQFYIDPLPPDAVDKMAKYNQEIATYAEYQAKLAAAQNIVTRGNVLNVQTMALKEVNAQLEIAKQKYKDDEASCLGYKDRLVSLNTALDGEKTKLKAAQDQLGKDTDAYHTALDAVKGYSDQIKELQDQIASPSQSTQAQAIQTEIDRLNLQKLQAADGTDTTAIDAQLAALQKQKDILDLQIKIAEDEANTPEAQIAQLKIKQQAAQDAADAALKAMQSDTTSINELNRSIIATQTSIDTINNKIKTALAHDQEAIDLKTSVVNNITQMVADSKTELDKLSAQLSGTLDLYNFNIAAAAALANANAPLPSVSVAPVYPGQAVGGITRSPGLSWVGEAGPELLSLPAGATVTPLDKVGGGIYVTVNVAGSVTAERNLADIIGEQIVSQVRESIGARR